MKNFMKLSAFCGIFLFLLGSCAAPVPSVGNQSTAKLRSAAAPPVERPGLATGFGSRKGSQIAYTEFTRTSSKPAGTDVIYYNDKEGAEAMAFQKWRTGAVEKAAGGLVEWGLKKNFGYWPAYKDLRTGRRLSVGKKGATYGIYVKNRSLSALEIVASVDGLDVQDGRPATFSKRGYIVQPGDSVVIKGFRTSESDVAAFTFSSTSESYANLKHNNTRNIGVVGLAVFTQKGVNPWKYSTAELQQRGAASPFAEAP